MSGPDFNSARQKNLAYGVTYGDYTSIRAPHWAGSEGDVVAQTRMAWPSLRAKQYFHGDTYNQFAKMQVETALQGEGRDIGDFQTFTGGDDYTPQIGRTKIMEATQYPELRKVSESSSSEMNEALIVGIVVVGALGLLYFITRS